MFPNAGMKGASDDCPEKAKTPAKARGFAQRRRGSLLRDDEEVKLESLTLLRQFKLRLASQPS